MCVHKHNYVYMCMYMFIESGHSFWKHCEPWMLPTHAICCDPCLRTTRSINCFEFEHHVHLSANSPMPLYNLLTLWRSFFLLNLSFFFIQAECVRSFFIVDWLVCVDPISNLNRLRSLLWKGLCFVSQHVHTYIRTRLAPVMKKMCGVGKFDYGKLLWLVRMAVYVHVI